jgi:hypothetical protein
LSAIVDFLFPHLPQISLLDFIIIFLSLNTAYAAGGTRTLHKVFFYLICFLLLPILENTSSVTAFGGDTFPHWGRLNY